MSMKILFAFTLISLLVASGYSANVHMQHRNFSRNIEAMLLVGRKGQGAGRQNSQDPQKSKPSIRVECRLGEIHDDPREEELYAYIDYLWEATNCSYVLIEGEGDAKAKHPCAGSIRTREHRSFMFIAVGPSGSAIETAGCIATYKHGPGRHGLVWSYSPSPRLASDFGDSYKESFNTTSDMTVVRNMLVSMLQNLDLTVRNDDVPDSNSIVLHTSDFNYHPLLCGDECGTSPDQRVFEFQIALQIWAKKIETNSGRSSYKIEYVPIVMRRYRMVGGNTWERDKDEKQHARPLLVNFVARFKQQVGNK